jgi:methionyl-tRNA formyltransferase
VQRVPIDPDETAGELEDRLAEQGAELVLSVIEALTTGTAEPVKQNRGKASKAPRLQKEDGEIDWSRPAAAIKNQVRALDPWPRAYTHWQRPGAGDPLRLIIHRVGLVDAVASAGAEPGTIVEAGPRLVIAAGANSVELLAVQPSGKRVMTAGELLRGYPLAIGERLISPRSVTGG